jgi:hypothetical protein
MASAAPSSRGSGLIGLRDRDEDIDRLADDFIAEDRGEATERFIDWAIRVRRAAARRHRP